MTGFQPCRSPNIHHILHILHIIHYILNNHLAIFNKSVNLFRIVVDTFIHMVYDSPIRKK